MNQKGRSMIEMLGVLAIIGVLSAGGIAGYSKAMMKHKTNKTSELIVTLVANIQNVTLRDKNYSNNLVKIAKKMKALPDNIINGSQLVNPFGGSVELGGFGSGGSGVYKHFYVAMNNLPRDACIELATADYGKALVYAGNGTFSAKMSNLASKVGANLKQANATCSGSSSAGVYCIKQTMSPDKASVGCTCSAVGGCNFALITF